MNVLIALLDDSHVHHAQVIAWFNSERARGWSTCPLTENGFVRIVSHRSYSEPIAPARAIDRLSRLCAAEDHSFWPDDVSLRRHVRSGALRRSDQVTDTYLLALAVAHGGRLATFDAGLSADAVAGGQSAILMLSRGGRR